jgi:XRE family transcriptional regulator, regulator of sulfur utilization
MSLNRKITDARKNKGLTQEELADKASVTTRTIQRIESGETVPRNFTLKAIAEALGISFEELIKNNNTSPALTTEQTAYREEATHFLQMVNLSSFTFLLIPYIHFLIPRSILKRKKDDAGIMSTGRKIIRSQVYWVIALNFSFLLVLAYNIGIARNWNKVYINYLWPFFVMYFLNAIIILATHFAIRRSFR